MGQSEGFEKDLIPFTDSLKSGFITHGIEVNNSIYANYKINCDINLDNCYSEIHKYNSQGDLIWSYKLDSLIISFSSFTVGSGKIYIVGRNQNSVDSNYFRLATIDTLGNFINNVSFNLNSEFYTYQESVDINCINDNIYIAGIGFNDFEQRFIGYIRIINEEGIEQYFNPWDQIGIGYRSTLCWEIIENENIDSMIYFSIIEYNAPVTDFLPTTRHCVYSLNINSEVIDTVFQTDNRQSSSQGPALFDFKTNNNIIYSDFSSDVITPTGIEVGEISFGDINNENAKWISRISKSNFEDDNILSLKYGPLEMLLSEDEEVYISGLIDWARFNEEILWNSTCFIAKYSSEGEFLWQKIYVEKGDGITDNKSQYIFSLNELENKDLLGVGVSSQLYEDSTSVKGWMLKVNEFGCLDNTDDCPFINFLDTTTSINNTNIESLSLEVYPNPVQEKCNIKFQNLVSGKLKLYDLRGNLIQEFQVTNSNSFELNTSNLNSGAYALLFFENGSAQTIWNKVILVE